MHESDRIDHRRAIVRYSLIYNDRTRPGTQAFSSRSHDLARNFVTSPIRWRHDILHRVESSERKESAWVLGWIALALSVKNRCYCNFRKCCFLRAITCCLLKQLMKLNCIVNLSAERKPVNVLVSVSLIRKWSPHEVKKKPLTSVGFQPTKVKEFSFLFCFLVSGKQTPTKKGKERWFFRSVFLVFVGT